MKPENVFAWGRAGEEPPAQAEIEFERDPGGRTYVGRSRVGYPYHVGRTLDLPEDPPGMASLYLQSCSGGVFEHERLDMRFRAAERTRVHLTTGASTIVHAMRSGQATQSVHLVANAGAMLEYLPEPSILFSGARLLSRVLIDADHGSVVIASESFLFHDPAGTGRRSVHFQSETEIRSRNVLLARDRMRLDEAALQQSRPGMLGKWRAQGTLFLVSPGRSDEEFVAVARTALAAGEGIYAGASRMPNDCGVWVRILAMDAVALKAAMHACWSAMRERLTGLRPAARRK